MKWSGECYLDCVLNSGEIEGTDMQFCRATMEEYHKNDGLPVDQEGMVGGIPVECPIYQCEIDPPWDQSPEVSFTDDGRDRRG